MGRRKKEENEGETSPEELSGDARIDLQLNDLSNKFPKYEKKEIPTPKPVKNKDTPEIKEVENPYTIANRAIDELVNPKNTMLFLSDKQIRIILTCFEIAVLPTYFGEEPVTELAQYCQNLKRYLISKGGRGRKDILKVLRLSGGMSNENVNKNIFRQLLQGGREEEEEGE